MMRQESPGGGRGERNNPIQIQLQGQNAAHRRASPPPARASVSCMRYTLEQAGEISGLSTDTVWAVCDRMGCSPDAVPAGLVQELRFLVGSVVDSVVARALSGAAERRRRVTA